MNWHRSLGGSIAERLVLPQVTLCAVTSVNVSATIRALEACLGQITFADCILFTDASVSPRNPAIRVFPIARIISAKAYSDFLLSHLVDYVETSHCLVVQWDGHVLDAGRWQPDFLEYDYIGASWPQFDDGHDVGNGGFSLRSRRLMHLCRSAQFRPVHPEDVAIGRTNRTFLEGSGMRFAPREAADLFAAERTGDLACSFGFHGVFNMPKALGVDDFFEIYLAMDERNGLDRDFFAIMKQVWQGRGGFQRVRQMVLDRVHRHKRFKGLRLNT